eukprot:767057-Hanusia_phi.AAC.6
MRVGVIGQLYSLPKFGVTRLRVGGGDRLWEGYARLGDHMGGVCVQGLNCRVSQGWGRGPRGGVRELRQVSQQDDFTAVSGGTRVDRAGMRGSDKPMRHGDESQQC